MRRRRGTLARRSPSATTVAIRATFIALVVYFLACLLVDVLAVHNADENLDARLVMRSNQLVSPNSAGFGAHPPSTGRDGDSADGPKSDDLDGAPIFAWWVPSGPRHIVSLVAGSPSVPPQFAPRSGYSDASIDDRPFRVLDRRVRTGELIVASSLTPANSLESTLLISELVVLPFVALSFFAVALVIGRRASAPVERVQRRQLEFAADASHELRTPLSVIEAEVGLALSAERSSNSYRKSLERVASESGRLKKIVDDLLWLARVDASPRAPSTDRVDVSSVVADTVARFQPVAARREIALAFHAPGSGRLFVRAPSDWLDHLVAAIVDNACRYAKPGGAVDVSVSAKDDRVSVTVDDDGPGIPPDEREAIFARFHRATRTPGGSGLGLSIADSVVRATRGQWEIDSSPAGGARVRVSWPRVR